MTQPLYDTRPARTLANARKHSDGHRLSDRDFAELKRHAAYITQVWPDAKLVSFHKRRRRSLWFMNNRLRPLYWDEIGSTMSAT